jgi:putative transposase
MACPCPSLQEHSRNKNQFPIFLYKNEIGFCEFSMPGRGRAPPVQVALLRVLLENVYLTKEFLMDINQKYNPNIHHRRSIRLQGFDYSSEGMYFITIGTHKMNHIFGTIQNEEMVLSEFGMIADEEWISLNNLFSNIELDVCQVMPNHIHGIVVILNKTDNDNKTVGDIIGAYKSLVSNKCLEIFKGRNEVMGKLWHRNFYEHIIRDKDAYHAISEYIINNPANWETDKFY